MKKSSLLNIFNRSGFNTLKNMDLALSNRSWSTYDAASANTIFYGDLSSTTGRISSIHCFVLVTIQ